MVKYQAVMDMFYGIDKLMHRLRIYADDNIEIEIQEAIAELLAEALVFVGFATIELREGRLGKLQ